LYVYLSSVLTNLLVNQKNEIIKEYFFRLYDFFFFIIIYKKNLLLKINLLKFFFSIIKFIYKKYVTYFFSIFLKKSIFLNFCIY
jgi:hypothetical protein